jgi:hypothetical protein
MMFEARPLCLRSLRSGALAGHNDNRPLGLINLTGNDTNMARVAAMTRGGLCGNLAGQLRFDRVARDH